MIDCVEFQGTILTLARIELFVVLFGIIFTSFMILNQVYGLLIGLGTIDRMKRKSSSEVGTPVLFKYVFGIRWISYFLPLDPVFHDEEVIFRYVVKNEPLSQKA